MTPTMSEYFEAWKNSRFVAGSKATESGFVGASRLEDIASILGGLVVIYDNIEPQIAEEDPAQAEQTGASLGRAARLRREGARRGEGRQEVHRRGGRDARHRRAGAGRGDRRPGLAGGREAEHRARRVRQPFRLSPPRGATPASHLRRPRWRRSRRSRSRTMPLGDGAVEGGVRRAQRSARRGDRAPRVTRPPRPPRSREAREAYATAAGGRSTAPTPARPRCAAALDDAEDGGARRRRPRPRRGARRVRGGGPARSAAVTLSATDRGEAAVARRWLLLRDFRTATRFTRPGADATLAIERLGEDKVAPRRRTPPSRRTSSTATRPGCASCSTTPTRPRSAGSRRARRRPPPRRPGTGASSARATSRTAARPRPPA